MLGVYLDTAWHRTIGRDSFFILPHLFIYGGGVGVGGAAVAGVLLPLIGRGGDLGGLWLHWRGRSAPFGWALAGLGILVVLAAGPVDAWWHETFGKDVLIWSPPHLQLHLGAGVAAVGLLFAVAGQRGRGALGRPVLWHGAMILVLVDLVHRAHFVLAHYTMIPQTRTPDLYPFLVALLVPAIFVAGARAVGPWAPAAAATVFLLGAWLVDRLLVAIAFDRYTLTPILAVPALALWAFWRTGVARGTGLGVAAGAVVTATFLVVEAAWMAVVVARPWPLADALAAAPVALLTGIASGGVGWVTGGFLVAAATRTPPAAVFGSRRRARLAATAAVLLTVGGLVACYRPQRFGPPMTVAELRLAPLERFRAQEAVFWETLLEPAWPDAPRIASHSEGVIEGFPLPVGPAWCAASAEALAREAPAVRFALAVNGAGVDLARYPRVRLALRDGRHCEWVGVASLHQRASENRFAYRVEAPGPDGARRAIAVETRVVFKDP
jgi:hypothetical protein